MPRTLSPAVLVFVFGATASAQLAVTAVSPAKNQVGASPAAPIVLTFSAPLAPASVTNGSIVVFGKWSGPVPGAVSIGATGTTLTFQPSRPYFAAESVSYCVKSSVTSTTGSPLVPGFASTFWVRPVAGSGTFSLLQTIDIRNPGETTITTYGIFAGDVDADGSPDITAPNETSNDVRTFLNSGCGTFGPKTIYPIPGQQPSPNEGGDFNGDGVLDLLTGNQGGNAASVLFGNGAGGFQLPALVLPTGGYTHGIAAVHADGDGDLDIAAVNSSAVRLFLNNGNGTFAPPLTFDTGGSGEDNVGAADANEDGIPDLFVGNYGSGTCVLLLGNGVGGYTVSDTKPAGGLPFQMAVGDLDGDGDADAVLANRATHTLGVVRSDGAGGLLAAVTYPAGNNPAAVDLGDLDGDDDLDVIVSNYGGGTFTVYFNNGAGIFQNPITLPSSTAGSCATIVDFDRDGDSDIITTDEIDDQARLWQQVGPNPPGVQAPSCEARLLVNSHAGRAGFGAVVPEPLPVGRTAFLRIAGAPAQPFAAALGASVAPGTASPFGLVNLDLALAPLVFLDGFAGGLATNSFGEIELAFPIDPSTPTGGLATLQALVANPALPAGSKLTNPETVLIVP
jgi:FG-GAP-like repeat/Bacterial Ig-like domain